MGLGGKSFTARLIRPESKILRQDYTSLIEHLTLSTQEKGLRGAVRTYYATKTDWRRTLRENGVVAPHDFYNSLERCLPEGWLPEQYSNGINPVAWASHWKMETVFGDSIMDESMNFANFWVNHEVDHPHQLLINGRWVDESTMAVLEELRMQPGYRFVLDTLRAND